MLNRSVIRFSAVAAIIVIVGCRKDPSGPTGNTNTLTAFFATNRTNSSQIFSVQAGSLSEINGADGVRVFFEPNAFRNLNGDVVTGPVQVSLLEVLRTGDMVWLNVQTLGRDGGQQRPLISGGAIRLTAAQAGNELQIAPGTYDITIPTEQPDASMGLFVGTEDEGTVLWDPVDTAMVVLDTTGIGNGGWGYYFVGNGFDWINCDYFMSPGGGQTSVSVSVPNGYTPQNTQVGLVFPNSNSVTGLSTYSLSTFSTGTYYTLPVGLPIIVVGLFNNGTEYRSGFLTTTVTNGMSVTLEFEPTTLSEFEQDCQGL
jgi:hypothetical protein